VIDPMGNSGAIRCLETAAMAHLDLLYRLMGYQFYVQELE
jgi:hypothetical protein